ncbi:MAG: UDP-N-acetylmuramate dehydrogenase [Clostridiaceae bacterium]
MDKIMAARLLSRMAGSGNVLTDELMARHTSFRIGGPADILVTPGDTESLAAIRAACAGKGIPVFVMGNGTNLIVRDKGIRGVVIKIRENMSWYEVEGEYITAQAGILLSRLSRIALDNGLSGLEFAEGIPGTLGGAVAMNAGAYDGEMSMVVESTEYLCPDGKVITLDNHQHCFGKRSSFIQADKGVVLKSRIRLQQGDREQIKARMEGFGALRREKQPLDMPSAGSIFKRPEGYFTGKLVQDCGLKGFRIGGAEVSRLHCGFIINTGNATASDVTSLISHIQDTVRARFGVELQTEVKVVGEE